MARSRALVLFTDGEDHEGGLDEVLAELKNAGVIVHAIGVGTARGAPIPVEVTRENSATKAHEMYSVFLEAKAASIVVNGSPLPGSVQNRQFFGRSMSTAFLAFSETWVTPAS